MYVTTWDFPFLVAVILIFFFLIYFFFIGFHLIKVGQLWICWQESFLKSPPKFFEEIKKKIFYKKYFLFWDTMDHSIIYRICTPILADKLSNELKNFCSHRLKIGSTWKKKHKKTETRELWLNVNNQKIDL